MGAIKLMALTAVAALLLGGGCPAWGSDDFGATQDPDQDPPPRSPQAYYVPDQEDLPQLQTPGDPQGRWGWLRRAFTRPGRLEPGRDDPRHDRSLDQGP